MSHNLRLPANFNYPSDEDFLAIAGPYHGIISPMLEEQKRYKQKSIQGESTFQDLFDNYQAWKSLVTQLNRIPSWSFYVNEDLKSLLDQTALEKLFEEKKASPWWDKINVPSIKVKSLYNGNEPSSFSQEDRLTLNRIRYRMTMATLEFRRHIAEVLERLDPKYRFLHLAWSDYLQCPTNGRRVGPFNPLYSENNLSHSPLWTAQRWDRLYAATRLHGEKPEEMEVGEFWVFFEVVIDHGWHMLNAPVEGIDEYDRKPISNYPRHMKRVGELVRRHYDLGYQNMRDVHKVPMSYLMQAMQATHDLLKAYRHIASITEKRKYIEHLRE